MSKLEYGTRVVDQAGVHWIIWEAKPNGLALVYEVGDGGGPATSRIAIIETKDLFVRHEPTEQENRIAFARSLRALDLP